LNIEEREIKYLQGVGPRKAEVLKKEVNIVSFSDLLYYFPYRHFDRTKFWKIADIEGDMPFIQLKGKLLHFDYVGDSGKRRLVGKFTDGEDVIDLVWFNGFKYVTDNYKPGVEYIIFGKPREFQSSYNIPHPDIDSLEKAVQVSGTLTPLYNTTEAMKRAYLNSRAIQNLEFTLLNLTGGLLSETLPTYILQQTGMDTLPEALKNVHFPDTAEKLQTARLRLKFDELFYIQLNILLTAKLRRDKQQGIAFRRECDNRIRTFIHRYLPFSLTGAQLRVMREIRTDIERGRQMNRLLQGDVGSGKTLVALMSMLIAVDNGFQACMMAPTEILANQHYMTLREFIGDMDVKVGLLTGSVTGKRRRELLAALSCGELDILVGTHALIEKGVEFKPGSPGLAVIDEQHRFGVEQRARLWIKSAVPPHVLIMSATPIPRTLAMTLYGDLDVSVIDEMPPGRKPVRTTCCYENKRASVYRFLSDELRKGRQAYIVYPLIEESENLDYQNLEDGFLQYCRTFPMYKVAKVHGKMKAAEKEAAMQLFVSGEARLLVATTVIEVGVNVPNASVMVIESAERFGLSQLHQLRGRVGRGSEQSYCILIASKYELSKTTRRRLKIMAETTDGFRIAEEDLQLRGAGDLEGTQQSGDGLSLKIANIATDGAILQQARIIAETVLANDPSLELPENSVLRRQLTKLFSRTINWGLIS
jgi:ATP-dependent DNA helicase RecG